MLNKIEKSGSANMPETGIYFETEVKEVQIKRKVSSLDQFGLGRIIENEMQFGEKIYENNKKQKHNIDYIYILFNFLSYFSDKRKENFYL